MCFYFRLEQGSDLRKVFVTAEVEATDDNVHPSQNLFRLRNVLTEEIFNAPDLKGLDAKQLERAMKKSCRIVIGGFEAEFVVSRSC